MKLSDLPIHHAVLVVDEERNNISALLWNELQALSLAHRFFNQTVLDIDTARTIITWANTPYNDEKIALISFHTASLPAQNAMLKVIEEPPQGVRFILLTSNKANIIDTFISRVREIKTTDNRQQTIENENARPAKRTREVDAEEFLQTPHSLRMKLLFVIELLAKIDEEGRKDKEAVRNFILYLANVLQNKKISSKYILETMEIASYASDPSSSGKALIEYLSLLLPQVKNSN